MTLYDIKPAFQDLLRPACNNLAKAGVSANQVTVAAMLLSLATGTALVLLQGERWVLLLVPAALLVRMALNAIDGMLAREHHMQSALGGLLNELGDVISDIALYLPFGRPAGARSLLRPGTGSLGQRLSRRHSDTDRGHRPEPRTRRARRIRPGRVAVRAPRQGNGRRHRAIRPPCHSPRSRRSHESRCSGRRRRRGSDRRP